MEDEDPNIQQFTFKIFFPNKSGLFEINDIIDMCSIIPLENNKALELKNIWKYQLSRRGIDYLYDLRYFTNDNINEITNLKSLQQFLSYLINPTSIPLISVKNEVNTEINILTHDELSEEIQNCLVLSMATYEKDPITFLINRNKSHSITNIINGAINSFNRKPTDDEKQISQAFILATRTSKIIGSNDQFNSRITRYISVRGIHNILPSKYKSGALKIMKQGSIYSEFYNLTSSIPLAQFVEWLNNGNNLVFTGHSTGGAISSILCLKLLLEYQIPLKFRKNIVCITFGQPLIVDDNLANFMNISEFGKHFHSIINETDPIPTLINIITSFQLSIDTPVALIDIFNITKPTFETILNKILTNTASKSTTERETYLLDQIIRNTIIKFHPFGNYHINTKNGLINFNCSKFKDVIKLQNLFSHNDLINALKSDYSLNQHSISSYVTDNINLIFQEHTIEKMNCEPQIERVTISFSSINNECTLKLNGRCVSFITEVSINDFISPSYINDETISHYSVEINCKTTESINQTEVIYKEIIYQSLFFDFPKKIVMPITVINYELPTLLYMLRNVTLLDLLKNAYWFILLDKSNGEQVQRLRFIISQFFKLIPYVSIIYEYLITKDKNRKEVLKNHFYANENNIQELLLRTICKTCNYRSLFNISFNQLDQFYKELYESNKNRNLLRKNFPINTNNLVLDNSISYPWPISIVDSEILIWELCIFNNFNIKNWKTASQQHEKAFEILKYINNFHNLPYSFPLNPPNAITIPYEFVECLDYHQLLKKIAVFIKSANYSEFTDFMLESSIHEYCTSYMKITNSSSLWKIPPSIEYNNKEPFSNSGLRQIYLIHELRLALATPNILLVGLTTSGKSTAVSKIFGGNVKYGGETKDRTTIPGIYQIGNLRLIDCPGANDSNEIVQSIAKTLLSLPGICIVFLKCMSSNEEAASRIINQLKETIPERPLIVCLNQFDEWYKTLNHIDQKGFFNNKVPITQDLKLKMEIEWKNKTSRLLNLLDHNDILIPTIIDTTYISKIQLERIQMIMKVYVPKTIRGLLLDKLTIHKWFTETDSLSYLKWQTEMDQKI